ncbi:DUF5753 domain-containing protein [Micromonospora sp. NBC_01699]|uniref:Scr1 family TA system antitoxin-like transcriptional regulator n=1 Tax=Micromonospora sp. NBC_01699 TaxID=2975984 RepID=UPI002E379EBE|nr:Scr1 family TA system antitoxin-like transcriptional regulator [Micromonospora sp. NBC_01699]
MIPGLLKRVDYARAVFRSGGMLTDGKLEESVALRLDRQSALDRERPPLLTVVIDKGALRRPVGGPPVGLHLVSLSVGGDLLKR